ncbi:MAG: TolC family protein [candidate division Zixibacteria bacterium]|nr:TolC family protein [candidate division Zixibacteria bacterium]
MPSSDSLVIADQAAPAQIPGSVAAVVAIVCLAILLLSSAAWGADQVPYDVDPDSALALTLSRQKGTFIELNDAVALALKNATAVREADAARQAARGSLRSARGAFDPELFATAQQSGANQPASSPFLGADVLNTRQSSLTTGARMRLRYGTTLQASIISSKLETNSLYATLNPQYSAFGNVEFTQPLLKGFGPAARGELSAAERLWEAAQASYDDAVLSVTSGVEKTYWDLYAAERDMAVQELSRDRALAFLQETQMRANGGLVGPNQVANARVFLSEQEQALLDREENLDLVSDQLATWLGQRPGLNSRYRPSDAPPIEDQPVRDQDSVVANALAANRSLRVAAIQVESLRELERGARWNALPALNLFGSIGSNGLSGTGQHPIFGTDTLSASFTGGPGETWHQVFGRDFPTWTIGVRLSFPLGLRAGAGERNRLHAEVRLAMEQQTALRRSVEEDVRAAHRELQHAQRRLESARSGVDAAGEQVRIGTLEYRAGRTTAFELVRLSADLATAQQRYSQALVRAAKAAADLKRLTSGGSASPIAN